ncbi:lytic transglycosylase domain-containing protein [Stenotrophomonas sp.]|uniref:lytic transglycosylase domain-containing protein n=1 Tax=Stenotrophomonas sp. TaxID=69392 RepID=UPI002FC783D0
MRRALWGAAVLATAAAPAAASPPVYAALGSDGRLQVSQAPAAGLIRFDPQHRRAARPSVAAPRAAGVMRAAHAPRWAPLIEQVAGEFNVDARLLHAIVQTESGYNPRARSPVGALGLMQVIPATGARFGADDLLDPLQNLRAGTAYLVWLNRRFDGDLALVLAAYNAGEGAVMRHGNRIPPYTETRRYVQRVRALYTGEAP